MKRVGIYLRVSTDTQTTENQRRELEAVAKRSGWLVVGVYEDAGISGAKGCDKRPGCCRTAARACTLLSIAASSLARLMLAHSLSTLSCDGAPQYSRFLIVFFLS